MNKRQLGTDRERLAAAYLSANGMTVLETNFRSRQGEIDIVGRHEGYLVFVEVKYRRGSRMGNAMEAVDGRKQQRICRVAEYYLYSRHLGEHTMVRYDVVAIQGEEIRWIQNAFSHITR